MNQERAKELLSPFFSDMVTAIFDAHRKQQEIRHSDLQSISDSFARRDIAWGEMRRRLESKNVVFEERGPRKMLRFEGVVVRFRKLEPNGEPSDLLFKPEQGSLPYHEEDELLLGYVLSPDRMSVVDVRIQRRVMAVNSGQSVLDWEFSILSYADSRLPSTAGESTSAPAAGSNTVFEPKRRIATDENEAS